MNVPQGLKSYKTLHGAITSKYSTCVKNSNVPSVGVDPLQKMFPRLKFWTPLQMQFIALVRFTKHCKIFFT